MMSQRVSWIHFGDLHIAGSDEQNYRDFLTLIDEANRHMEAGIDFAVLPGDNADDGEEDEYQLVRQALGQCRFPVHAITGDHDVVPGTVDLFRRYLADPPYNELRLAHSARERVVVFMHAYPSEHGTDAAGIRQLFHDCGVLLVEMGHTHYNELANDGRVIYAATRSTGQIEEGPAGFSVTTLDDGVVSWKFKPIGEWPLVMVTSPADERLIIDPASPSQVVSDSLQVRARVWGPSIQGVTLSVDGGEPSPMSKLDGFDWGVQWDAEQLVDGRHELTVTGRDANGQIGSDRTFVCVNRRGEYAPPARQETDYENALGAWAEKHILGTQLGPNENGHPWPPRRERVGVTQ